MRRCVKRNEKSESEQDAINNPSLEDQAWTNVSLPHPYFLVSLLAYRLRFANGISPEGWGSWNVIGESFFHVGSKYHAEPSRLLMSKSSL